MEKLKTMWNDLSKKGKIFVCAVAAIILWVIINNWFL